MLNSGIYNECLWRSILGINSVDRYKLLKVDSNMSYPSSLAQCFAQPVSRYAKIQCLSAWFLRIERHGWRHMKTYHTSVDHRPSEGIEDFPNPSGPFIGWNACCIQKSFCGIFPSQFFVFFLCQGLWIVSLHNSLTRLKIFSYRPNNHSSNTPLFSYRDLVIICSESAFKISRFQDFTVDEELIHLLGVVYLVYITIEAKAQFLLWGSRFLVRHNLKILWYYWGLYDGLFLD